MDGNYEEASQRSLADRDHWRAQAEQHAPPGATRRYKRLILLHNLRQAKHVDRALRIDLATS